MYSIVAAAKALYDQLGMMGEMSIDGDSFLDLWIYIIVKANIRDLVGVVSSVNNLLRITRIPHNLRKLMGVVSSVKRITRLDPEYTDLPT